MCFSFLTWDTVESSSLGLAFSTTSYHILHSTICHSSIFETSVIQFNVFFPPSLSLVCQSEILFLCFFKKKIFFSTHCLIPYWLGWAQTSSFLSMPHSVTLRQLLSPLSGHTLHLLILTQSLKIPSLIKFPILSHSLFPVKLVLWPHLDYHGHYSIFSRSLI